MPYFDPAILSDVNLLHSSVREHSELSNVAAQVEYDVIDHYTEEYPRLKNTSYKSTTYDPDAPIRTVVKLHGYDKDPEKAESNLKEALRRTIATVISATLKQYDNERNLQSERLGNRSYSYAGKIPTKDDWPNGWDRRLSKFDNRDVVYGL